MPRKPRLHVPGGLYHVILRGNGRRAIFFDCSDRHRWEALIDEGVDRYRHRVHAYCWMTNHIHMAIQSSAVPLSRFMGFVASQYARSTNKKINRSGHLFERRYRAILVQEGSYLKELVRYIHQNPLRAGITEDLIDYRWSSHSAYLTGNPPKWLTVDWVLSVFGETVADARHRYANFMRVDGQVSIWRELRAGVDNDSRVLGDDRFLASLCPTVTRSAGTQSLGELVQDFCQIYDVSETELTSTSRERKYSRIRAEIGLAALEAGVTTIAELARCFNRSQSGVSRSISRLRKKMAISE